MGSRHGRRSTLGIGPRSGWNGALAATTSAARVRGCTRTRRAHNVRAGPLLHDCRVHAVSATHESFEHTERVGQGSCRPGPATVTGWRVHRTWSPAPAAPAAAALAVAVAAVAPVGLQLEHPEHDEHLPGFREENANRKNRLPGGRRSPRIQALDQRLTVRSLRGARSSRWRTGRPGRAGERGVRDRGATALARCSPSRRSPPLSRCLPASSLRAAWRTRQGLFSARNSASRLWAAGRIRPSPSRRPSSRPSASSCSTARPVTSLP